MREPPSGQQGKGRRQGRAVPEGLRLGRGHRRLPDRGRRRRGRQGPVGVGRLLQEEGRDLRGQHRRRRLRPLPPLQGRRRADEDAGGRVVPLQHLVAARAARGDRRGQPEGARLLQPPGRRAAQERHHADVHAVPLGLPAGAVQARRLAQPRFGRLVRRVRGADGRQARRSHQAVGHAERAPVLHRARAARRRARAGRQAQGSRTT